MPNTSPEINIFGQTDFRNLGKRFGIKLDDRRRHMYVIGKTGMGKSTMLENMVINDMWAGHGVALIDPHGDLAEKVIDFVPPDRVKDIVYFNPADTDYPLGFNILESVSADHRHLIASGLMGVFKKIWPDVWSARMEYILNNTILSLLECNNTTLLSINRLLADQKYRKNIVNRLKDPVVRAFWINEFDKYADKYKQEAIAPVQNKIGQFLSASIVRNIVAQSQSTFNVREIMDSKKIFIVNLSKGRIGEDASRLLGGMIITKIQLSAMERVDTPESERKDFFLYVDEFQNFATESFAGILSEARKYRLSLIMAHQYVKQLDEKVADAVFGNVGTIVSYRVGADDAELLEKEFEPTFMKTDIVNLPKFHVYLKLMIDGIASQPFSAEGLAPILNRTHTTAAVIAAARANYSTPRQKVEDHIRDWSLGDAAEDYTDTPDPLTVAAQKLSPIVPHTPEQLAAARAAIVPPARFAPPLPPSSPTQPPQGKVEMPPRDDWFAATCIRCGAATTVPFKPDGKRKIYCKDCYKFRHEDEDREKLERETAFKQAIREPEHVSAQPSPRAILDIDEGDELEEDVEELAHVPDAAVPSNTGAPMSGDAAVKKRRRRKKKTSGFGQSAIIDPRPTQS